MISPAIKSELQQQPTLPAIKSLLCTAMIMGYVGEKDIVLSLLQQLSHSSRAYCMANKNAALKTFVIDEKPFRENPQPKTRFTKNSSRESETAEVKVDAHSSLD